MRADPQTDLPVPQAFNIFGEALSVLRQAPDIPGQAFVLNEIGATHREFGDHEKL